MGVNVRVPGGWVGTQSVGVRAGPVSVYHAYGNYMRTQRTANWIVQVLLSPITATLTVIFLIGLIGWLIVAAVRVVGWLIKWATAPLWLPLRAWARRRRRRRITRLFARPPQGLPRDPVTGRFL